MLVLFSRVVRDWVTQDRARRNAGQAAVRMMHRRRDWTDLEAGSSNPVPFGEPAHDEGHRPG